MARIGQTEFPERYLASLKAAEEKEEFVVVRSGIDLACLPVDRRSSWSWSAYPAIGMTYRHGDDWPP
jgi:hypothetical protein